MSDSGLRGRLRWCGLGAALATLAAYASCPVGGRSGPDAGMPVARAGAIDPSRVTAGPTVPQRDEVLIVRQTRGRPVPRATAAVAPPAIVKILRRGDHSRELLGSSWPRAIADLGAKSAGFGPRATQAALVANAADLVWLSRWLL